MIAQDTHYTILQVLLSNVDVESYSVVHKIEATVETGISGKNGPKQANIHSGSAERSFPCIKMAKITSELFQGLADWRLTHK